MEHFLFFCTDEIFTFLPANFNLRLNNGAGIKVTSQLKFFLAT